MVRDGRRGDGHPARGALLLGLTVVAASIDALSYLGLGRVFPANMTGNTVLLGIGLATGDIEAASRSATALVAFLLGAAAVGAALAGRLASGTDFVIVVVIEIGMIAALTGWWLRLGVGEPTGASRYGLIAIAGVAMGAQSGMTRSLGVPVATTYITGTWTTVSVGTAALLRRRATQRSSARDSSLRLQALVVAAYLTAAAGTAVAYRFVGAAATAVPLAVLMLSGAVGCIVRAGMQPGRGGQMSERHQDARRIPATASRQLETGRVAVTEWRFPPGAHTGWHRHDHDYVVVPITAGELVMWDGTREVRSPLATGVPYARDAGVEHDVINPNEFEFVFVEIELMP